MHMKQNYENLAGKILVSTPYVYFGSLFNHSVIYMLSHAKHGSMGLIVNHLIKTVTMSALLQQYDIANNNQETIPVYLGGPVEKEKGFFLHSSDYDKNSLLKCENGMLLSSNTEIIKDITNGIGPQQSIFILGYTGWMEGQLEFEIENNFWLVLDCKQDLIFSQDNNNKWENALKYLGISQPYFSSKQGSC